MAVSINNPVAGLGMNYAVATGSKVMVNNDVIFTISNGPIQIINLMSESVTANDATASTMQYSTLTAYGNRTISGASVSLASSPIGTTVLLGPTAFSTGLNVAAASAGGAQLGTNVANRIIVMPGVLRLIIGVGSTTGMWMHYLTWMPLSQSSSVEANQ
jgi:hypothetical protein